jgi:hypothetical protein
LKSFIISLKVLLTSFVRDDYREFAELCLLAIGEPLDHHFKKPGPTHHARWMGKIIYTVKMFLFRHQLDLPKETTDCLRHLTLFYVLVYAKAWLTAPNAADAPVNDLQLFNQLQRYKTINKTIANAALDKLSNHLWYLGPEYVPLALFSDQLNNEEKRKLQMAIVAAPPASQTDERKLKCDKILKTTTLSKLVSSASIATFELLGLDAQFMTSTRPSAWKNDERFHQMKAKVQALKVVNDTAERAIGFVAKHNADPRTRNEETFQKILQSAESHCHRVPNVKKSTLAGYKPIC